VIPTCGGCGGLVDAMAGSGVRAGVAAFAEIGTTVGRTVRTVSMRGVPETGGGAAGGPHGIHPASEEFAGIEPMQLRRQREFRWDWIGRIGVGHWVELEFRASASAFVKADSSEAQKMRFRGLHMGSGHFCKDTPHRNPKVALLTITEPGVGIQGGSLRRRSSCHSSRAR
jgi:hypothetical protein